MPPGAAILVGGMSPFAAGLVIFDGAAPTFDESARGSQMPLK